MEMTIRQADDLLSESRYYVEKAKKSLRSLGVCCQYKAIGKLMDDQDALEAYLYDIKRGSGLGWVWLALTAGSIAAYIGSYIYKHYTEAKVQSQRLECIAKYQQDYINAGWSADQAAQKASEICDGYLGQTIKTDIISTLRLAIYGSVAIFGLYVVYKVTSKT